MAAGQTCPAAVFRPQVFSPDKKMTAMQKLKAVFVNRSVIDWKSQRLKGSLQERLSGLHRSLLHNLQKWKQQQPKVTGAGAVIVKMKCKDYHPHLLVS